MIRTGPCHHRCYYSGAAEILRNNTLEILKDLQDHIVGVTSRPVFTPSIPSPGPVVSEPLTDADVHRKSFASTDLKPDLMA
jgi:hypothetical protein